MNVLATKFHFTLRFDINLNYSERQFEAEYEEKDVGSNHIKQNLKKKYCTDFSKGNRPVSWQKTIYSVRNTTTYDIKKAGPKLEAFAVKLGTGKQKALRNCKHGNLEKSLRSW